MSHTIANLVGSEALELNRVAEAIHYRSVDNAAILEQAKVGPAAVEGQDNIRRM